MSVGPDTSCPFAQNVREQYMPFEQEGSVVINVYSPVTQETYPMNCVTAGTIDVTTGKPATTDNYVTCRGGNNAEVSFPR